MDRFLISFKAGAWLLTQQNYTEILAQDSDREELTSAAVELIARRGGGTLTVQDQAGGYESRSTIKNL